VPSRDHLFVGSMFGKADTVPSYGIRNFIAAYFVGVRIKTKCTSEKSLIFGEWRAIDERMMLTLRSGLVVVVVETCGARTGTNLASIHRTLTCISLAHSLSGRYLHRRLFYSIIVFVAIEVLVIEDVSQKLS
jgi:hypothetical protein